MTKPKKYFGDKEILSQVDNTFTFKGGEQKELTIQEQALLISEEPLEEIQFTEKKYLAGMTLMSEMFDTLNLTFAELVETIHRFDASFKKQKDLAIVNALWITVGDKKDPSDLSLITYKDMLRNQPKK